MPLSEAHSCKWKNPKGSLFAGVHPDSVTCESCELPEGNSLGVHSSCCTPGQGATLRTIVPQDLVPEAPEVAGATPCGTTAMSVFTAQLDQLCEDTY